jgi:CubicO group peptidase (beta-lactamase class C family)
VIDFDGAAGEAVLRAGVAERLWPGAVAAVGTDGRTRAEWVLGHAEDHDRTQRPMRADTVFDLASLTKVLATAPAVLLLAQRGLLALDDRAAAYLPGLDERVRVGDLLTHTSGLPPHRDLSGAGSRLVATVAATPLERAPGEAVAYSDLGFILLGAVVEQVCGQRLDAFVRDELYAPVGSHATFSPGPDTAATEVVDGRAITGRVHDENAASATGAVGHAGLFGSLADVRVCLRIWQDAVLDDALRREALRDHTAATGGHRGLGWTCRGDGHDILSAGWGGAAVSHTGFTGTSVALDPRTGRWAILLTNAVHYGRNRPGVLPARRRWHAAVVGD